MTFHSELTAPAVWPADIATALGVPASSVSVGRRPDQIRVLNLDISILRDAVDDASRGAFDDLTVHPYLLTIRASDLAGHDQAGEDQQISADAAARTLFQRYRGRRPTALTGGVSQTLVGIGATEPEFDLDPDTHDVLSAQLAVTFVVDEP